MIIDGNNMVHRMLHTHSELRTAKGVPTGVLYGVINSLRNLVTRYAPAEVVFAWDSGESWRTAYFPYYKSKRKSKPWEEDEEARFKEFYAVEFPLVKRALCGLCIPQLEMRGLEADDLIMGLITELPHGDIANLVVSTDKDMLQLTGHDHDVRVLNPITDVTYEQTRMGLMTSESECLAPSAAAYLAMRCVIGDSSDSIPGVYGLGPKTAEKCVTDRFALFCPGESVTNYSSLENFIEHQFKLGSEPKNKIKTKLQEFIRAGLLERNYHLMSLLDSNDKRRALMSYGSRRSFQLRIGTLYMRNNGKSIPQFGDLLTPTKSPGAPTIPFPASRFARFFGMLEFKWAIQNDGKKLKGLFTDLARNRVQWVEPYVTKSLREAKKKEAG